MIIDILGSSKGTFYIDIPANMSLSERVYLFYNLIIDDKVVETINITVVPRSNSPITYDDFQSNKKHIVDDVWYAEPSNGLFVVHGERNHQSVKRRVQPNRSGAFVLTDGTYLFSKYYFDNNPMSIVTMPIKIRPSFIDDNVMFDPINTFAFRNIGINFDLLCVRNRRYDLSGNVNSNSLSLGLMFLASIDEVDLETTENHFFFSSGISFSYKLNHLSLLVIPLGFDITSSIPNQADWAYAGRLWWGVGLGVNL